MPAVKCAICGCEVGSSNWYFEYHYEECVKKKQGTVTVERP